MRAFVVVALVMGPVLAVACGGATTSEDDPRRTNTPVPGSENGSTSSGAAASSSGDPNPAAPTSDAAASTTTNAFTGAPAFVAVTGKNTVKGQNDHPFPGGNPARQDCLGSGCHGAGGEGPRFVIGGTVYKDALGTTPAPQVEVRVRDLQGNAVLTQSDANGNFFVKTAANLGFPAQTAARDATTTKFMSATIANGACNAMACHGSAVAPIHVP